MRVLLIILLSVLMLTATNKKEPLEELLSLYHKASLSSEGNIKLEQYLLENETLLSESVKKAYQANVHFFNAQYFKNPIQKFNEFKKGKVLLESVLTKEPENPLFRYFRYAVQLNTPAFLNYNSNIDEDRRWLNQYTRACMDESKYLCSSIEELLKKHAKNG